MKTLPSSLRIGVIRGGISPEYDISLKTGGSVLKALSETHNPIDIFISQDGKWHIQGIERSPERILKTIDVAYNALHGIYGEDGGVQEILEHNGIPYTGSNRFSSAISMNKFLTKKKLISHSIKTPVYVAVRRSDSIVEKAKEIFEGIPHPLIVKPANGGSSHSQYKVESFSELLSALEKVLENYDMAVVEEYITGIPVSCLVTENFRDKNFYTFPPVENISISEKTEVQELAKLVHNILELSHYSNSDFIVSPRRGIYFLEVNTSPKLQEQSKSKNMFESVGSSIKDFVHHTIGLALGKK